MDKIYYSIVFLDGLNTTNVNFWVRSTGFDNWRGILFEVRGFIGNKYKSSNLIDRIRSKAYNAVDIGDGFRDMVTTPYIIDDPGKVIRCLVR